MNTTDQRTGLAPSRRAVVRSAAWTVPVVAAATAAPAYATSTCADGAYRIRWGTASEYNSATRVATASRTATSGSGTIGDAPLTMTITNSLNGVQAASIALQNGGVYSNLTTSPSTVGGLGTRGLTIMQRAANNPISTPRAAQNQVVTFTFSRPVWDLKFTFTDIDSLSSQYRDRVELSPTPPNLPGLGAEVQGAGTATSPFRPTTNNNDHDPVTESLGNVTIDYTGGPRSAVYTVTYWNDQPNTLNNQGLQGVFISNLTFSAETCA